MKSIFFVAGIAGVSLVSALPAPSQSSLLSTRAQQDVITPPTDREPVPLNTLLYWITQLFPFDVRVKDADDLTLTAESRLAALMGAPTSQDITTTDQCVDVTIVFARGTSEAGNVGILVGPQFFDAVASRLGPNVTLGAQGVNYAADIPGYLEGGDPDGSRKMADDVKRIMGACPNTKMVMSGYSQGGQLVHKASRLLSEDILDRISATVIFGDPDAPSALPGIAMSRQLVICHDTDIICGGGDVIHLSHLTYAGDVDQAADFVIANL